MPKSLTLAILLLIYGSVALHARAQAKETVVRVEVEEKEFVGDFKIAFDAGNYWIEAKRTQRALYFRK